MNIAEILKDCPKGKKFYSPVLGVCHLKEIKDDNRILIESEDEMVVVLLDSCGKVSGRGECILFPTKTNRDWSTFEVPKVDRPFKPFDRVISRLNDSPKGMKGVWSPAFFSRPSGNEKYPFFVIGGCSSASECLPYNEKTAKLIGTTDDYTEEDLR